MTFGTSPASLAPLTGRRGITDIFRIHVVHNPDVRSPIITLGRTSFFYIREEDVYAMAATKSNANPALIFELLYRLGHMCQAKFGGRFNEELVKDNFMMIYELLDEVLDFGYPQNTDAGALNLVANAEGVRTRDVTREDPRQITTQATEPLSWRRADLRYRKNECYLDVIETLNLLIGSQGTVLRADVDGRVVMRAYLSGMPECKVGLNNELRLEHRAEPAPSVELADCHFHQCVRLAQYERERDISFVPPDGEFELMRYRSTANVRVPLKVHPVVSEDKATIRYTVHVRANLEPKLSATNIVLRIPVPPSATGAHTSSTAGKAKYEPGDYTIVWRISRLHGGGECVLQAEADLARSTSSAPWSRPPIGIDFQVLMFTSSGLVVRYLKVHKTNYRSIKWVRYVTNAAGSYLVRF